MEKPCNISNFKLNSIFQLYPGCSSTSLQELWLVHEAILQQCFTHKHISDSPEIIPCSIWTRLCVKFVTCLGKGERVRSCTAVEAALEPGLAQTHTIISTCTTIRTTQKQSENTESFMYCLGSLVTSQIIIPPYLLEEFGRKRRDCWKLAFKSGFP